MKCIHCICNIACFNINGELSLCIRNQLWIITIENCFQFGVRVGFLEFYWKFLVFTINISRVGFNKALHVKPHKMTTNHTDRKITTQKFYSVCDFHHMEPGPFKPPVDAWIGEQHTQCTNTIDDTLVVDIGGDYKHTQCFMSKLTSFFNSMTHFLQLIFQPYAKLIKSRKFLIQLKISKHWARVNHLKYC